MPGAGDAPRARGVRARVGAPSGVGEGGDVWDVREATFARNHPANVGSVRRESDDSATLTDTDSRARRVGLDAHLPDSWIRVVVDSVLLDDAPFEPPEDAASARASENFRSAGGEPRETVRVLTAVLRTVTDGRDRLFPLVASALVEPADGAIEPEPEELESEGARVHEDDERRERPERPTRSVPEKHAFRYDFAPPPRAPRPTSRAPPSVRDGDVRPSVSSRASYASRRWPPAPAPPRHDPLEMCFEYLNNCLRPAKKKKTEGIKRSASQNRETNERDEYISSPFTAYGGDRSGSGMHQDVDYDVGASFSFPEEPLSRFSPESEKQQRPDSLEDIRAHLERCAAEEAFFSGETFVGDDFLSPSDDFVTVEPRDVDDVMDALEDRFESAYLVVDASANGAGRGNRYGQSVSASARLAATLYATSRDVFSEGDFSEASKDASDRPYDVSDAFSSPRAVRFETADWLESGASGCRFDASHQTDAFEFESEIVGLESFLALCAATRRNVPIFVSRDVADAVGLAPDAWRPSFRSARRMRDKPMLSGRKHTTKGGVEFSVRQHHSMFDDAGRRRRSDFDDDDANAIGAFVTRAFEAFLRGVAESVAEDPDVDFRRDAAEPPNASPSLIDPNARGVPLARSDSASHASRASRGLSADLGEALLGGPVVFFRAAARAWAEWYRKEKRKERFFRPLGNALAGEDGFASSSGDFFFVAGRARNAREGSPQTKRSADALRLLTGKRGDLAANALLRSRGSVGTVTALDRRSMDCVASHRMTVAAATRRKRFLRDVVDAPAPNHVAAATLLLDAFRDADPDAKALVESWARRVARGASDADACAEDARALDETVAARAAEVDECVRAETRSRADDGGGSFFSPGRAVASLELAVVEDRWADAARWRDALRRVNGRCADHEAVFGAEPGEDGHES